MEAPETTEATEVTEATKTLILPTPDELNEIYSSFGTSEDKIDADVKLIAEWMRIQPHLPDPEVDERRIRSYLILCKNSVEKTKDTLDQYYTIKSMVPEYFRNRDPTLPALEQSMNIALLIPLPKLTKECYRVSMIRLNTSELDDFVFADHVKINFMTADIRISKLDTFKKEIFIYDFDKYTASHHSKIFPELKKLIYCATMAYPLRIHQVHILNMPNYAQSLVNLARGILKKKIADRIVIHENIEDLNKHIDVEILPLDYGGTFPKTSEEISEEWKEELIKNKDWFLSQNSVVGDENKRVSKFNLKADMLAGIEGSFRQLEVD